MIAADSRFSFVAIIFALVLSTVTFGSHAQAQSDGYVYISVERKELSKKLRVTVDFGDTPEQIKAGEEYSEILSNKKSYAAVLNHMAENGYELVATHSLEDNSTYHGTGSGGTSGVVFIMRKKK